MEVTIESLKKEIEKLKAENSKLKQDKKNLAHRLRNKKLAEKAAESRREFSAGDKLMMVESIIFTVIRSSTPLEALAKLLCKFNDDEFWRVHKNSEVKEIIRCL